MILEVSLDLVYLPCGSTDLRKSIDRLEVLVRDGKLAIIYRIYTWKAE
jgi:hypothetical protein